MEVTYQYYFVTNQHHSDCAFYLLFFLSMSYFNYLCFFDNKAALQQAFAEIQSLATFWLIKLPQTQIMSLIKKYTTSGVELLARTPTVRVGGRGTFRFVQCI